MATKYKRPMEYATAHTLINENTGYGFFGVAAGKLGYRQAAAAYNEAMNQVVTAGFSEGVAREFLISKAGRWWAENLDWSPNYGDDNECRKATVTAWNATRMNMQHVVPEHTKP